MPAATQRTTNAALIAAAAANAPAMPAAKRKTKTTANRKITLAHPPRYEAMVAQQQEEEVR